MKNIRKYFAMAKILFKAQLVYRFDVLMSAAGTVWNVVFAVILWTAVYNGRETVGGLTLPMMLSYYVITSFLNTSDLSAGLGSEVSGRILGGTFSKYMVVPANPQLQFLAQTFGASAYYMLFAVPAAAAGTLVFGIDLVFTADPLKILLAAVMYLLGIAFMNFYLFYIGLWAFKFQEIGFMLHIVPNIVSFLRGEFVPLSLLPDAVTAVVRFLPFTHAVYTPAMLLIGAAETAEGIFGLTVLALWTLAMAAVNELTYKRFRTKYEGVGI